MDVQSDNKNVKKTTCNLLPLAFCHFRLFLLEFQLRTCLTAFLQHHQALVSFANLTKQFHLPIDKYLLR